MPTHAWMDIASNATRLEILSARRRPGRLTHAQLCTVWGSGGAGGMRAVALRHSP